MSAPRCAAWRAATSARSPMLSCQAAAHFWKSNRPSASGWMRPACTARVMLDRFTPRTRARSALVPITGDSFLFQVPLFCSSYLEQPEAAFLLGCSKCSRCSTYIRAGRIFYVRVKKNYAHAHGRGAWNIWNTWNNPVPVRVLAVPDIWNRGVEPGTNHAEAHCCSGVMAALKATQHSVTHRDCDVPS